MKKEKENSIVKDEGAPNVDSAVFHDGIKKLLKYSFIIISLAATITVSTIYSPQSASAQTPQQQEVDAQAETLNQTSQQQEIEGQAETLYQAAVAKSAGTVDNTLKNVDACDGWLKVITSPVDCGLASLANLFLTIVSRLLWLAGIFFNLSMSLTLNLAALTRTLNIDATWAIVRDIVNITFIFSLLWIAAATVLDLEGGYKKHLAGLIIAALLINFSLFFTKVIIDISNTIALQFYSSITAGEFNNLKNPDRAWDGGISAQFMDRLKITTIYSVGGVTGTDGNKDGKGITAGVVGKPNSLSLTNIFMVALFGSIFIIIAAAVFLIAGIMFLTRSAVLVLLMVTSPIGYAGSWLPKLKTYTDEWWSQLFNQSMLAPVFLMFVWVILKITEPVSTGTSGAGAATSGASLSLSGDSTAVYLAAAAATGGSLVSDPTSATAGKISFGAALAGSDGGAATVIFNFMLIIAFLMAALIVAKKLSGQAGALGAKLIGTTAGVAGGFLGRNILGRAFGRVARSEALKSAAAEVDENGNPTARARMAMMRLKTYEGIAKSSFDIRSARLPGVAGEAVGGILGGAQIDLGLGKGIGAGGYRGAEQEAIKERVKKQEAVAKLLEEEKDHEAKRRAEEEAAHKDREEEKMRQRAYVDNYYHGVGFDEKMAREDYDQQHGAGAYDALSPTEFKISKTAQQISDERKRAFAEQLRTTPRILRPLPTQVRGDLEAARSIDKSTKSSADLAKLEGDITRIESDISEALVKLGRTGEITADNIKQGNEKLITELAHARAVKESLGGRATIDQRATANANLMKWEKISDTLNQSPRELDQKKLRRDGIWEREGKKSGPSPKLAEGSASP